MPTRPSRPSSVLAALLLAAAAACARAAPPAAPTPSSSAAPADTAAAREVVAAVQRMFDAMRTRDTAALRALLDPALVFAVSREGDAAIRRQPVAQFIPAIAMSRDTLRERMWSPEVRVDGAVAMLWAPYDFHRGAQFTHCGHDTFLLARTDGRWVVTALSYTVRTTDCATAPAR